MIKLVVSDVDGTLVPDGTSVVNPQLFDVILKLREKGIQVAIASGRPWASIEKAFEPVKEKFFIYPIMELIWAAAADHYL